MKKQSSILIVNYEYPPLGGGGAVATKNLAEQLVKNGHKVTVLTTQMKGLKDFQVRRGVHIYRVPVLFRTNKQKASLASMLTWPITSILKGRQLFKENKFDLIHTHFFAPSGPTGDYLSRRFGVNNVIYAHGADVYDPERINKTPSGTGFMSKLLKKSLKSQVGHAKKIITQSNDTKCRLLKIAPEAEEKTTIIPLPFQKPIKVSFPRRRESSVVKGFKLVSVGRLVKRKGYKYLLEAMATLPDDVHLNIIGDGPEKNNLQFTIDNLQLGKRVKLLGYISEEEKYEVLSNSDCYVLSSLHEGMGIVLQEAMYMGLAIVSTNYGGQVDLVEDGVNGFLVDPKSPDELKDGIMKIYNDRELVTKFGNENMKRIEKYYSENLINEYIKCFESSI